MNGEVFDILNYCILNEKFYIHKQKLFHENALDFLIISGNLNKNYK